MYSFGPTSLTKLETCHDDLKRVAYKAIEIVDFSIISGHRDQEEQDRYYIKKVSKKQYPYSKHNKYPSLAFDFAPYPIRWDDIEQFTYIAGIIMGVGHSMNVSLRWGNDWNMDGRHGVRKDFNDYGHVELFERRKA